MDALVVEISTGRLVLGLRCCLRLGGGFFGRGRRFGRGHAGKSEHGLPFHHEKINDSSDNCGNQEGKPLHENQPFGRRT